jgi:anaerobic magnesium-protoporphyrin IX monomethyl ester cyclase
MRVLLVGAELEENLALRYLAAALERAGHHADFARFDGRKDEGEVLEAARRTRPDLVGMSMTFQFRAIEFGELAGALRKDGYRGHITGGGHFPTFAFEECLERFPGIDSIVRHEGETTLVELCDAVRRGGRPADLAHVRGLAYRTDDGAVVCTEPRPLAEDLDALPFPKRIDEPQLHLGIPAAFLVGTRGCFGHCTFCCIHAYLKSAGGEMYRWRSPENVADEMAELRRKRGARMFVFHDDDFFTRDHERDYARMVALRDALRARRVTDIAIVVKARPDDVDPRVFSVLREIGLLRVYLGIEAGSTRGLRVLGRGVGIADNRRALEFLRKHDVYTCFNMLVFDPESTLESLRESFAFLRQYSDVPMNFCRTEIYVGTPLMTKLAREERLVGDVFGWDYAIRDVRAERAFRIFAQAFLDRNFRCDGLMNSTLGLGYHLHLLRTFYPHAMTPALRELATETTRAVNLDCNEKMVEIFDFAASERAKDPAAFEDFTNEMTRRVEAKNRELEDRVAWATETIAQAALAPRVAKRQRARSRWGALSAATLALAPLTGACDKSKPPPPPDPLPIPTLVSGPPDAAESVPTIDTTAPPPDPVPPPSIVPLGVPEKPDAGVKRKHHYPHPPDPVPRPTRNLPPPDPPPPPHTK